MNLNDMILLTLFVGGSFLMFLAGVGLVRMPDIFLRMSAATKASTLGAGFLLLGAALYFDDLGTTSRSVAIIIFLFLTAPVAAHRIARAAYFDGSPLWNGTLLDELRGHYDSKTHELVSDLPEEETSEEGAKDGADS